LLALEYASVSALIVVRHLSTIPLCVGEYLVLGTETSWPEVLCLIGMVIGAWIYGTHDITMNILGLMYLLLNCGFTACLQLLIKRTIKSIELSSLGLTYYNNLLSVPVFVLFAAGSGEFSGQLSTRMHELSTPTFLLLALSVGVCHIIHSVHVQQSDSCHIAASGE